VIIRVLICGVRNSIADDFTKSVASRAIETADETKRWAVEGVLPPQPNALHGNENDHHLWMRLLVANAAREDIAEIACVLIVKSAPVNAYDEAGRTALITAATHGSLASARVLLAKDAKVDARDKEVCTALAWATMREQTDVMRLLLDKGAQIGAQD